MSDVSERTVEIALRGESARLRVSYGVNDNPGHWGFDLLGLPEVAVAARGFPVLRVDVEHHVDGYGGYLG